MTGEEKATVHEQLEELQKKDWKVLSIDEKKAGAFSAFGLFRRVDGGEWGLMLFLISCSVLRGIWPARPSGTDEPAWG